ncbi:MAG TPA: hypothetical protein VN837_10540 [Chloroflexota bacterium]|nr:hypothetical protein [Chloroflexota bacterium]
MRFFRRPNSGCGTTKLVNVLVAGLLGLLLVPVMGADPANAQSQALRVTTITTTTKAVYDAWKPSSGEVPSKQVNSFPHGTKVVEIFFEIDGGIVHKTTYQLRVVNPTGIVISGPVGTVSYTNYIHTNPLNFQSGAKPGKWTIKVLVNGKVMGTHSFILH